MRKPCVAFTLIAAHFQVSRPLGGVGNVDRIQPSEIRAADAIGLESVPANATERAVAPELLERVLQLR